MKLSNIASLDRNITSTGRVGLKGASVCDREVWAEFVAHPIEMKQTAEQAFERLAAGNGLPAAIDVADEIPEVIEGKTRIASVVLRVNQARFRRQVLASYDAACCISGLRHERLLIASHIVPWSSDVANRLNPSNGLCLSALHDKAYDAGLITVLPDYTIRFKSDLLGRLTDPFLSSTFKPFNGKKIRLPRRFAPTPEFLEQHAKTHGFI